MKLKTLLIALIITLSCNSLIGQKLSFGLQAGVNFSSLSEKDNGIWESPGDLKAGYLLGANLSLELDDWVALRTELNLDKRNGESETSTISPNGTLEISRLKKEKNYWLLPIILQLEFGKNIEFITQIGTTFNYIKGQTVTMKELVIDGGHIDTPQDYEAIVKTDLTMLAGVGFRIPILDKIDLMLLARGHYDLLENDGHNEIKYNNWTYSGSIGIQYLIGTDWDR